MMQNLNVLKSILNSNLLISKYFFYCFTGFGVGIIFMSVMAVIQQYFDKKRTLANGFVVAGISLGNFAVPPLTRLAVDKLGWRITLSLCACLVMQNVWLCGFYRPAIPPRNDEANNIKDSSRYSICKKFINYLSSLVDFTIVKDPIILLFLISTFCLSVSFTGFIINLVNKAMDEGVEKYKAAFIASVSGIINALWRPIFGVLATFPVIRKNKYFVLSCLLFAFGLSLGILGVMSTFESIIMAVCLVSLSVGKSLVMGQKSINEDLHSLQSLLVFIENLRLKPKYNPYNLGFKYNPYNLGFKYNPYNLGFKP